MEINLLDMGTTKYGDCILITHNNRSILIDGGHPGDSERITLQLRNLLQQEPPFEVDLLIVTHCHSDHIGCLPNLVKLGDLRPKRSLLADPKPGFAEQQNNDGQDDGGRIRNGFLTALQEEDRSDLDDADLEQFLFDAERLSDKYKAMLEALPNVQLFTGIEDDYAELEAEFADFGLEILGPTRAHIKKCADLLAGTGADAAQLDFAGLTDATGARVLMNAYRQITRQASVDAITEQDKAGPGAAKNDQSIVLAVGTAEEGWKALLTGDMQFAKAEVNGLAPIMKTLVNKVNAAGPYDFIKLPHHSSYNGLDENILQPWLDQQTSLFAHSGGVNDPTHPDEGVLELLKANKSLLNYARTDRNGITTVNKSGNEVSMSISKGRFNDFTPNSARDQEAMPATPAVAPAAAVPAVQEPLVLQPAALPAAKPANGNGHGALPDDMVEVITRVPSSSIRVTVSIDVDAEKKKPADQPLVITPKGMSVIPEPAAAADGRFSGLLFVTSAARLVQNIGQLETQQVIRWIQEQPGSRLVDLPAGIDVKTASAQVVASLGNAKGVVIIGGYDVVPAQVLDVLTKEQRQQLVTDGFDGNDGDNFIVWSDDCYADNDGDSLPELPLSRVPDGRSSQLLLKALNARPFQRAARFGLRNSARPFAVSVYDRVPGTMAPLEVSEKCTPEKIRQDAATGAVYLMLHGSDMDGTRFWGEKNGGGLIEAMNVGNVPVVAPGTVVFSGCCWGALTVLPIASRKLPQQELRPRSAEQSMALSYLHAGALAFVGCTGSHYSPGQAPYNYFGQPMHDYFWQGVSKGNPPAVALFEARQRYAGEIPHGHNDSFSQAVELKIFRQYSCLGLGW